MCRLSLDLARTQIIKKTFRSKVILQCCTHPLEQAARQASPNKRSCFFWGAVEITFVFNFAISSSPSPHPVPPHLPHVFFHLPPHPHTPQSTLHLLLPSARSMWFSAWSQTRLYTNTDTDIEILHFKSLPFQPIQLHFPPLFFSFGLGVIKTGSFVSLLNKNKSPCSSLQTINEVPMYCWEPKD